MNEPGPAPLDVDPFVLLDEPGLRVTVLPVGWIAVRPPHVEWAGPWPLRYPAILSSARWSTWMPVTCVLVQTASDTVLVDTGEAVDQPSGPLRVRLGVPGALLPHQPAHPGAARH